MNQIVYLNGQYISLNEAHISPLDRGFVFADGVYEVIRYYDGQGFEVNSHIERLKQSLEKTRIICDTNEFNHIAVQLIRKNKLEKFNAGIYIQVTRGAYPRKHQFPTENVEPTVYVNAFRMEHDMNQLKNGMAVITKEDIRWLRCDIKSISLLPNTMLFQEAIENNAAECLMYRKEDITEATHSSFLAIRDHIIYTHPLNEFILPGITRKIVINICHKHNIKVIEKPVKIWDIHKYDELLVCGTGNEITPVTKVDSKTVNNGKPGKITRFIQREFFKLTYGNIPEMYDWDFLRD